MFDFFNHRYSLAATGIPFVSQEFTSRYNAEQVMYDFIGKHNLSINEVWDDKHYKTYLCENGVKFYINRVY